MTVRVARAAGYGSPVRRAMATVLSVRESQFAAAFSPIAGHSLTLFQRYRMVRTFFTDATHLPVLDRIISISAIRLRMLPTPLNADAGVIKGRFTNYRLNFTRKSCASTRPGMSHRQNWREDSVLLRRQSATSLFARRAGGSLRGNPGKDARLWRTTAGSRL